MFATHVAGKGFGTGSNQGSPYGAAENQDLERLWARLHRRVPFWGRGKQGFGKGSE